MDAAPPLDSSAPMVEAAEAFLDAMDQLTVLPELELAGSGGSSDYDQAVAGMQQPNRLKDLAAVADLTSGPVPSAEPAGPAAPAVAAVPASAAPAATAAAALGQSRRARPRSVLLRDKLAFVLGSTCLWVCAFWLGHEPASFYKLYSALGLVLFTTRYVVYRKRKWHYYLLDYCYWSNLLLLFHLWVAPTSPLLARTTFAFNAGPLTTSILAFRNSLVFHDMDKVTSLFLHLVPACVSWAQRWNADTSKFGSVSSGHASLKDLLLVPLAFYTMWAALYVFTVFVLARDRIKRRGYVTLFTYVTTRKRGAFAAITRRVPTGAHVPVYLGLHMLFCAASMLGAWVAWHSFAVHTTLLVAVSTLAIFHGATFYFDVFATRYHTGEPLLSTPATPRGKVNDKLE